PALRGGPEVRALPGRGAGAGVRGYRGLAAWFRARGGRHAGGGGAAVLVLTRCDSWPFAFYRPGGHSASAWSRALRRGTTPGGPLRVGVVLQAWCRACASGLRLRRG